MNKKFRNEIRDSFNFPDPEKKDIFLNSIDHTTYPEEDDRRKGIPIPFRIAAAVTACAVAASLWIGLNAGSGTSYRDYDPDNVTVITGTTENDPSSVTTPAVTTDVSIVTDEPGTASVTSVSVGTDIVTTAVTSAYYPAETTAEHTGTGYFSGTAGNSAPAVTTNCTSSAAASGTTPANRTSSAVTTSPATVTAPVNTTTAVQTGTPPVTTTNNDENIDDDERSIVMKKVTAYALALSMLPLAVPTGASADFQPPAVTDEQLAVYSAIDNGERFTDFNEDGKFDAVDVYRLYDGVHHFGLHTSEELVFIREHGDINGDGSVNYVDGDDLVSYYVYKYGVTPDTLNPENYIDFEGIADAGSYMFVYALMDEAEKYNTITNYVGEAIEAGKLDMDFDANGTNDMYDAYIYSIYHHSMNGLRIAYAIDAVEENSIIGIEMWNRCAAYEQALDALHLKTFQSSDQLIRYMLIKNGINSELLTVNTYRDILRDLPNADLTLDTDRYFSIGGIDVPASQVPLYKICEISADSFAFNVKRFAGEANMVDLSARSEKYDIEFEDAVFEQQYAAYCTAVENGTAVLPDFNSDGYLNGTDAYLLEEYYKDLIQMRSPEESNLPADVRIMFDFGFDINGNGISGDIYDAEIADTFLMKHDAAKTEELVANYKEMQAAAELKKDIEFLCTLDIERSGDANEDGQVNMADAVLILQVCANPDNYQFSDWGVFNADVAGTGDGVTPLDAQEIQNRALGIA